MASCVAVLSATNSPLFIQSVDSESDEQISDQYSLHTSLDVIEEKIAIASQQVREL